MTLAWVFVDPPAHGAWNMAADEALLEWAAQTGSCAWRFYRWIEPTLSLGYFQRYEDRLSHAPSLRCPAVRRASGGGAIVHDAELTYSCVWPAGHRLAAGRMRLYEAVHSSLVDVLAGYGIQAALCRADDARTGATGSQPFLCFQRRAPGDVLVGPVKIAGSAQRRLRGAVLQHGSVLLARSPAAPELDGLAELTGRHLDVAELIGAWWSRLEARLELKSQFQELPEALRCRTATLAQAKYSAEAWTHRHFLPTPLIFKDGTRVPEDCGN